VPHTKKRDDSLVKPPFLGDIKNERGNILRSPSIDPSRLPKKRFLSISYGGLSSRRKEVRILGGARCAKTAPWLCLFISLMPKPSEVLRKIL
jgi:hypothetical protein